MCLLAMAMSVNIASILVGVAMLVDNTITESIWTSFIQVFWQSESDLMPLNFPLALPHDRSVLYPRANEVLTTICHSVPSIHIVLGGYAIYSRA